MQNRNFLKIYVLLSISVDHDVANGLNLLGLVEAYIIYQTTRSLSTNDRNFRTHRCDKFMSEKSVSVRISIT